MIWIEKDLKQVIENKEFIDTVLVPLTPISFNEHDVKLANQVEDLGILLNELERQYRGRVIVTPPFSYLIDESNKVNRLNEWGNMFRENGMKNIFFVTCDFEWEGLETDFTDNIMWIPSLDLASFDMTTQKTIVSKHIEHLITIFSKKW
ncbi:DUF2487 family protein [Bacillus sp. RG28]|uniref:DUF2487 family protein n=1 Tax=Gottfriedia endophytica TaxID=2820819 RepID=A0A940SJG3_9BACI|nr:DUF2487 family protein [Gottfriedia endophytica]MBP0724203.1 DUF2487 family protein [Gottfriedia endophytica]